MKKKELNQTHKRLLTAAGFVSLFLGVLGIVIPVLPTTPFLLLSAGIFLRSSEKWYAWLMEHKVLGPYIRNFQEKKAIPLGTKIGAISLLWVTIGTSILFLIERLWLQLVLGAIATAVTVHILHFKTLDAE